MMGLGFQEIFLILLLLGVPLGVAGFVICVVYFVNRRPRPLDPGATQPEAIPENKPGGSAGE